MKLHDVSILNNQIRSFGTNPSPISSTDCNSLEIDCNCMSTMSTSINCNDWNTNRGLIDLARIVTKSSSEHPTPFYLNDIKNNKNENNITFTLLNSTSSSLSSSSSPSPSPPTQQECSQSDINWPQLVAKKEEAAAAMSSLSPSTATALVAYPTKTCCMMGEHLRTKKLSNNESRSRSSRFNKWGSRPSLVTVKVYSPTMRLTRFWSLMLFAISHAVAKIIQRQQKHILSSSSSSSISTSTPSSYRLLNSDRSFGCIVTSFLSMFHQCMVIVDEFFRLCHRMNDYISQQHRWTNVPIATFPSHWHWSNVQAVFINCTDFIMNGGTHLIQTTIYHVRTTLIYSRRRIYSGWVKHLATSLLLLSTTIIGPVICQRQGSNVAAPVSSKITPTTSSPPMTILPPGTVGTSKNVDYEDYIVEPDENYDGGNQTIGINGPNVFAYSSPDDSVMFRSSHDMYFMAEMQRYDGWYNNLAHPRWGSTESHLTRKAPPSYSDGVYMMAGEDRPSPRELSQALMKGDDGKASARNLTVLFAFFGQMVSSEILMASEPGCPIEMHHIKIAKCDEMYDRDCRGGRTMPFHRAIYDSRTGQSPNNPREQLNLVTSWIDGSFVYSTSETWLNAMRTFQNGTFKTDQTDGFPPRNRERAPLVNSPPAHHLKMSAPEKMFLLGDPRTNQNPVILAFGILMFRWHNVLARRVQAEHSDWSDEDIFQRTRRLVIASLQNIIMYEYLETLFDEPIPPYNGYKPDVHPGISHIFQSAAFRFGHTMIPPGLYRRDAKCNFLKTPSGHDGIRLCSTWWDAADVLPNAGLEELIMGLSSQIAEREDSVLCSDVRDKLFGPLDFSRRDLAALNIMRGRDNGLADYNTIRQYFNLPRISNWSQINPQLYERSPKLFETLSRLYSNNLDNIDVYVGGMVESESNMGRPGPLFRAVIKEQFMRIRDSDRFWFENRNNGMFSPEEIEEIRKIKLWDIIVNVTNVPVDAIQRDVFLFRSGDPCPQPRQMSSKVLESCLILAGWNYFHGSELPYIMVILLLVFIPMVVAVMGYAVIKINNRRRRKIKQRRDVADKKNYDKLYVREWLHQNHKRYVKVKIGPDQSISTVNRKGETLRKIDIHDTSSLLVEVTQDSNKPMILIRAPRDHDLVIQFENNGIRKKFLTKLESFLLNYKKTLEIIHTYRDVMLANAETKEKRQKRLEHFFREAYALTFGLKPGEKRKFEDVSNDVIMVMRTSLSKKEFAEALGMKADSLFVKQMFNCVDKDNDGRISFQEFLDTVVLFSRGKTDNKLRIIFDMCDHDGNGVIDKCELTKMMRSLVDIAKTDSMTEVEVMSLIEGMFASTGLEDKEELTYDDFKHMMSEYRGDLIAIGLDCKGAKQNFLDTSTNIARMTSFQISSFPDPEPNVFVRKWNHGITYLEENRQPIVYLFIFFVTTFVLFLERFITYSYLSEHMDLRHVMGYGIAITRGSAASLSFCYSLLLLTMCRNLITKIREIPIHQYIPLDSHVQFHKIVALTGLFFTIIHTVGHCVNFYHVSTQPVEHLRCLTKELQFESDSKPTFSYWIFGTVTGLTGVSLVVLVAIIFIFAHPRIRQKAYSYFWTTHSLYFLLYILMFVHGLAKITGEPKFWIFFIVPGVIFILDKIVSIQTKYMELDILETDLLPSDVTKVKFSRPPNFKYLSGQWVRLCCTAFRSSEYHSLTLTSAPHENYLSVHVKAQGPWTWKLRNYFDPNNFVNISPDAPSPKIRLEGPFGGGNQDWYKYEIAVMVGGGIGVTPYASILNDLVFGTSTNRYSGVACKKVYFLWICPSHRHFEWFIDVLRDVERKDVTQVLEVHIFITQFFHKFDLRTTMLYICENHFQRISNRSMFTGLKAINHFGRPDMIAFLKFVQNQHSYVSKVGVFSCGPSALTKSISKACETVNNRRKLPYFIHQFENFG